MGNNGRDIISAVNADHHPSFSCDTSGGVEFWHVGCTCGFLTQNHASKQGARIAFGQHFEQVMLQTKEKLIVLRIRVPISWTDHATKKEVIRALGIQTIGVVGGFKVI